LTNNVDELITDETRTCIGRTASPADLPEEISAPDERRFADIVAPVNTHGGLLSQARASIKGADSQMRGQAGERALIGAETAIVSGQCGALGINARIIFGKEAN
jgi:hypothetical protein